MNEVAHDDCGAVLERAGTPDGSWRRTFGDVDEQAVSLDSLYPQHYQQLGQGRFRGEMTRIDLDGVIVIRERVNRRLMQTGTMRTPSIGWLIESEGRFRFNRQDLEPHTAIFYRRGSEFEIQAAPSDLIGVTLVPERLDDSAWIHALVCDDAPSEGVRRVPCALFDRLQHAAHRALALLDPADPVLRARSNGLRQELIDLMWTVATLPNASGMRRPGRDRTFDRVVRAAQRELSPDHPAPGVSIETLCRRIGVSRRNLFYAFDAVLGLSPHQYLQRLRLNSVRRAIKAQAHADPSIGDLASAGGFEHPSRFATDYRRLFDERPSDTLRRARDRRRDPRGTV